MRLFYNISITRKLIFMQLFTTIIVVIACSVVFLLTDYYTMKSDKEKSLVSITHVIGSNLVAPILFEDKETGFEILNDLRVEENVLNATILDLNNKPFIHYNKAGSSDYEFSSARVENETVNFVGDLLFIAYPIISENERIGTLWIRADVSDIKGQLYQRGLLTFWVILFGALLSFLLVIQLQRYITKPINKLVEVMSAIMKQKNYSLRSQVNSGDEIGKMSNAFNELLDDVEHYSGKLIETNNDLEKRVEQRTQELKDKNEKLVLAKAKEIESNKIKEQFMASISHEIRTPLNAILGFQELLQDTPLNAEQKEFLQSIDFAGRNLLVLINDILDISKIDAGKFAFNESEMDFRTTIRSVTELMEIRAKEKGISLSYSVDDRIPQFVYGDQARLSQVLINLIGNAVKFTEKGFVRMSVNMMSETAKDVRCLFSIEDTGIGIPKDKVNLIFDRFMQVASDTTKKYGGTGLGLSIVKEIVERQGGKIGVKSDLGVGSTFYFEFTFRKVQYLENKSMKSSGAQSVIHARQKKKLYGLLAEDIALNQQLVQKIMSKWGYQIDVVSTGKAAVEHVKIKNYDFVLMDIQMPEMDGMTATIKIRKIKDPVRSKVPIIALTAQASMAEAEKCLSIGMDAYMSKPFNAQELKLKINELIAHKENKVEIVDVEEKHGNEIYDLTHLIEHAEGDSHFLEEIYQEFIREMPKKLEELHILLLTKDTDEIHRLFHSLRGILPTFGMHSSVQLLQEITVRIDKKEYNKELNDQIENLESTVLLTMKALETEIKNLRKKDRVK